MKTRRRFKQTLTLETRLTDWAMQIREQAAKLRPGTERESLIRKARQAETAARLNEWINSPGLQAPT